MQGRSLLRWERRFIERTPFKAVKKAVTHSKGGGARSVVYKLRQKYSAISEDSVRGTMDKSEKYGYSQAKFTNKSYSVQTSSVFQRVQNDLQHMQEVTFKSQNFRYILTIVDVFSRFLFCMALT